MRRIFIMSEDLYMKKKIALTLALVLMLLSLSACGTTEGLKAVPKGERPETLAMDELSPVFPSDNSLKNEMMTLATDMSGALSQERQEMLYDQFLHEGFIYVVGPYNFAGFITDSGKDMMSYYDNMVGHLSRYLSDYDPAAWNAVTGKDWASAMKEKYLSRKCTAYSIRNTFNLSDSETQMLVQNMYTARSNYASALADGFPNGDQGALLTDLLSASNAVAQKAEYDNYLEYTAVQRESLPYALSDISKLCGLVKENLVPAVQSAEERTFPTLTPSQWQEKLLSLADYYPEYKEDLAYVLNGRAYTVEEGEASTHFGYMLYQYDFSAGKAILSGEKDDALQVLFGLGLAARNMALPESEWSISALPFYDAVQERAFAASAFANADKLSDDPDAKQALVNLMAQDACKAAMELELLTAIYAAPDMTQEERTAYLSDLCKTYDVEPYDFFSESDIYLGTMTCVGELLGDLYGLQLYALSETDPAAAEAVLHETLSVYNVGNPIAAGYASGLENPFNGDGIARIASLVR